MRHEQKRWSREDSELRLRYHIDTNPRGLMEWIHPRVARLGHWLDLLLLEKRTWTALPWRAKLKSWRHGFTSFSWESYDLDHNDPDLYLADTGRLLNGLRPNGQYNALVFSKLAFCMVLDQHGAPQPQVLGHIFGGKLYSGGENRDHRPPTTSDGLRTLLEGGRKLVLRPSFGGGGEGILFIERPGNGKGNGKGNSRDFVVNALEANDETFEALIRPLDDYLVTALVQQGEYAQRIFPGTTNTVMVITSQDGEQLCYQLLAQPFIGGFSIQCSVRSEKVIEGLPVA